MKARHTQRAGRGVVRFDPARIESDDEFVVDWEETDEETEAVEAREDAMRACGDRLPDE